LVAPGSLMGGGSTVGVDQLLPFQVVT